ncbi:hypothetical protein A2866_01020 [Candidatus Roizmanbacteria bacterium RIFCSPHIGHO2_01_FULL_39_8]|uniref:purine-nucleoside phosphorylase n=3 Tax=Candidatus Roizmaniibacteriota TaxID=1752723 RepID=A0A1F7GMG6_9BACT|nr:MAG: hypothetical protein A2866_01020 [Candidatus Roizmanbacteria bacterium RIFCSPHIGHO2_01_FULL_39_8]OGK25225.1 MAG: hypothetical protein A3C28_04610 [Candidatus Roizmanbacteria bacterium RIFCSPHIGHO2_02_FULL_39_9]OGK35326.1 MAG: hypothetical protein A3F60_01275 [Candidatus Roizmanbacteria bacterium RIFCSPHIGHO2_12_FULL_39_8]
MKSDKEVAAIIKKKVRYFPEMLIILGSGWNKILEKIKKEIEIPYSTLFGVIATVPGHEGKLVIGKIRSRRIAFMSGRFHTYEGYSAYEATTPIRAFVKVGMKQLILTAACGALHPKFKVGDFVILSDVITLFLALDNPLKGPNFVDVSSIFDETLRKKATEVAVKNKIPFHEGAYVYYHGPNYETPADKMALRFLGADVVGMSTVPEAIVAKSLNIKTLGLSFVTNLAFVKHDHEEVLAEANKASRQMVTLLEGIINCD